MTVKIAAFYVQIFNYSFELFLCDSQFLNIISFHILIQLSGSHSVNFSSSLHESKVV